MVGGKLVDDLRLWVRSMLLQIYFTGEPETLICNDAEKIFTAQKKLSVAVLPWDITSVQKAFLLKKSLRNLIMSTLY